MSRELCICPGVGGRKCGAFLSSLDRDPNPTCARCRGKICTRDMTCDFCGNFLLKSEPTRNERDHALQALFPRPRGPRPAWELLRKFRSLGLPPLLFPALQVGRIRGGGGLRVHLVLCPERLPPLPLGLGLARGGVVSLDVRPWCGSAPLSLQPLRELGRGRLLGRDGLPLPAPLPRLLLPAHHSMLRDVMSREKFRRTAPLLDPPVFPDLRIGEQGRIVELALGRTALVTVAVVLALAPLAVRGQEVRASEAVILSVAILPRAVAIFGSLLLSARALSFSGRAVSILGSIPVF